MPTSLLDLEGILDVSEFFFCDLGTGVQRIEDFRGFCEAAFRREPARAIRQARNGQDEDDSRDGDDRQHHAPVARVAEGRIREEGGQDADRDHELIARDDLAARILIRHLREVQRCRVGGDADREAEDQTEADEHRGICRHARADAADDEQRSADDQALLAADAASKERSNDCTCRSADHHRADDPFLFLAREPPFLADERQCARDDALVKAEEQAGHASREVNAFANP